MDITSILPEDCISYILSFTSPHDACSSSLVSRIFGSVACSDPVWERFLPSDYLQIISQSVSSGSSSSLNILSKKDLYFHLCHNPILIGNGNRSFSIDKLTGKKCYMLGARDLSIAWGDTPDYWNWIPAAEWSESAKLRFSEVAHLIIVWWLEIRGRIETKILSPNTRYGAYLIYTVTKRSYSFGNAPVRLSVKSNGVEVYATDAYLKSRTSRDMAEGQDCRLPFMRTDGWMEIEFGEFFNDQVDGVMEMCLMEINGFCKFGLLVHGIELRPK